MASTDTRNVYVLFLIGTIYEDVTTEVLGSIGAWQWLVVFVCTAHMVPAMFNEYEDMILLKPMNYIVCTPSSSYTVANTSLCYIRQTTDNATDIKCEKWHVKLLWFIWLKKSWLVFCDEKLKLISTTMISRVGRMFGCVIFGLISDSFGRKTAILIDLLSEIGLCLLITFCDAEGWYRLLVFLKSLCGSGNIYMGLVLICEIASNSWRSRLNTIVMTPRLIAFVCSLPLTNNSPNLETHSFIAAIFGVLFMAILRWTPESPQWLLYNRNISAAEKILSKAAIKNGISLCSDFKIRPVNQRAYHCLDESRTCMGVLSTYNIRVIVFASLLFWCLYYFQWSYLYVKLYGEENVEILLLKIFCFSSFLGSLVIFLATKFLLRHLLLVNVLVTGAFTAGDVFLGRKLPYDLLTSMALASSLVGHALLLNITPRLFATKIRATLFGFCQATGQLGSMICYLLFSFQHMNNMTTMAMVIGNTLTLMMLSFVFLDVDRRELPDVMEDMDYFSELSKPLRWVTQKTNSPSNEEVEMRVYSFGSASRGISQGHSDERLPARPIGFVRMWRLFVNYSRRILRCYTK